MAITSIGPISFPTEWIPWFAIGGIGLVALIFVLVFRRSGGDGKKSGETPIEQNLVLDIPVDEHGMLQMGRLVSGAKIVGESTDLSWPDPDHLDEETEEPIMQTIPAENKQPLVFLDENGMINKEWIVVYKAGERQVISASVLVHGIPQRFDPLEADPRQVGRLYVGWGQGAKGGLSQFVQTTWGKILVVGASLLIGYLLGMMTIAVRVGHF